MAAFMQQYIPGNPRVVFTNQPNKPLEYLFAATQAPKDGTYISWNSTPQLDFGFNESTKFIKRSTFQAIGSTTDASRLAGTSTTLSTTSAPARRTPASGTTPA